MDLHQLAADGGQIVPCGAAIWMRGPLLVDRGRSRECVYPCTQNGFRIFRETIPPAYLRAIRLRAARENLLDPSNLESIKDICLK